MVRTDTYIVVRAHGLKSRLLTLEDYQALIHNEKKLSDFRDYIFIKDNDTLETKLEKIYRVYVSRIETLSKADRQIGAFIQALLDRLEIENIKIHLRYLLGAKRPVIYYPYGHHIGPAKLSSIKTEGTLWEEISRTEYRAPPIPDFVTSLEAERELLLDILYYNYLSLTIQSISVSKETQAELLRCIEKELELKGMLWSRTLSLEIITRLASKYSPNLRFKISPPPEQWKGLKTTELMRQIEISLLEMLKEKVAVKYSLEIPFIYYYNALALLEANNLEKILLGKEIGIPEEVILRTIISLS